MASVAIRNGAKAVVVHQGKILVTRCRTRNNEVYYELPGGGQNPYETMEEAAVREVLEETGYRARLTGLLAVAEEIYEDARLREKYPDHTHRILHIFLAELADENPIACSETDWQQEACVWLSPDEANEVVFRPKQLTGQIAGLLKAGHPLYLGCVRIG